MKVNAKMQMRMCLLRQLK